MDLHNPFRATGTKSQFTSLRGRSLTRATGQMSYATSIQITAICSEVAGVQNSATIVSNIQLFSLAPEGMNSVY